jgi:hypothetical protein
MVLFHGVKSPESIVDKSVIYFTACLHQDPSAYSQNPESESESDLDEERDQADIDPNEEEERVQRIEIVRTNGWASHRDLRHRLTPVPGWHRCHHHLQ